jgi:hypothetical protein
MKLLIKFPTKNRSFKFLKVLKDYYDYIENLDNVEFLITLDDDDDEMKSEYVIKVLEKYSNLSYVFGKSESKIHAINRDLNNFSNWDIVLLASDDMIPKIKGFDNIIISKMKEFYPDTDGVLFFNDGYKKNELNTLCILGKKYYERFNYIYYPEYKSTWSDNEFTEVANILKKQTYFDEVIIKHEHPDWGYGRHDSIHNKNHMDVSYDRNLFLKRKNDNFGL